MAVPSQIETSVHIERHYAVTEIAEMWNLSPDKVRELFEKEPGVLVLGERSPRHKRRYVTLRIPGPCWNGSIHVYHRNSLSVRSWPNAYDLSPSSQELQAACAGQKVPPLPVPYLG